MSQEKLVVVGLGYVGLPVALSFARKFPTVGFDIAQARVDELRAGHDSTNEVSDEELAESSLELTSDPAAIAGASFVVVAVPTPVDANHRPDLTPLIRASETVGKHLSKGAVVVFESTVYPGVTEETCGPILAEVSGLECGKDFFLGYSPERINPGDKVHTFETIVKVVSGQDEATLDRVANVYASVVDAGVFRATSIKVAEAAKVIENTQRDLNIALINELAMIFDLVGIRTADVLAAAGTKWNFLPFTPGLVGGHCIGVDPYYLTTKAEELGYQPEVILAGRRINNNVGAYIGQRVLKMTSGRDVPMRQLRVGILGLTFKEDVPDLRNSQVPTIIDELNEFGIQAMIHDPLGDPAVAAEHYGVTLQPWEELQDLDALICAVPHQFYRDLGPTIFDRVRAGGAILDVKSMFSPDDVPAGMLYWSL